MKQLLILSLVCGLAACVSNKPKPNHSFFGGKQGELAPAKEAEAPEVEGPSEFEIDTGFGIAVTPPTDWKASEPDLDGGLVLSSPAGSVVVVYAYADDGAFLDRVKVWHEDFGKLAEVKKPLKEVEIAGQKAWTASYQLMVQSSIVSQTIWEIPNSGRFYRIHVGVVDVSDGHPTRTILDSLRFIDAPRAGELHSELLGASVDNASIADKRGSAKVAPKGWQKSLVCELPGCARSWNRDDAVMMLFRRDYASPTSATNDIPLWVSKFERIASGVRAAKFGKNSGHMVYMEGGRIWFGAFGSSIWMVKLDAHPSDLPTWAAALEKTIAKARFK